MRRLSCLLAFACLVWTGTAWADFTTPATLALTEVAPAQFKVVLTLPIINGRVLKARPVLPDICVIKGDLDERAAGASVIRTWQMECNPDDLAGTRQGAKITVKDVSVISLDEALSAMAGEQSFTYPCKWVVTARVQHLKHIHDRQNIYLGELTIGIEDDRWKIVRLVLKSEERVIKSWQTS